MVSWRCGFAIHGNVPPLAIHGNFSHLISGKSQPSNNPPVTRVIIMTQVTADKASQIITEAMAHARTEGYPPMVVAVVDVASQLKAFLREDGATALRFDIAMGKAVAAAGMSCSSRALTEMQSKIPVFFATLGSSTPQHFIPQTGAVLIKDSDGVILGAVGASGGTGDQDEAMCIAGVAAAGYTHE